LTNWAQSPIPNPQSPIPNPQSPNAKYKLKLKINKINIKKKKYLKTKFSKVLMNS
jgi:hypothetical protein